MATAAAASVSERSRGHAYCSAACRWPSSRTRRWAGGRGTEGVARSLPLRAGVASGLRSVGAVKCSQSHEQGFCIRTSNKKARFRFMHCSKTTADNNWCWYTPSTTYTLTHRSMALPLATTSSSWCVASRAVCLELANPHRRRQNQRQLGRTSAARGRRHRGPPTHRECVPPVGPAVGGSVRGA